MIGTKTFKTNELVLTIKKNSFDVIRYPLHEWERFIDILCGNRDYQKEAIKTCIIYLISEKYHTIEDIIEENYYKNETLREKYNSIDSYKKKLQLPHRKSGCIDLATGTGKSYVIYGIAQIALGLGIVDKVLVLGPPSTTIEKGLTDKFNALSAKPELRNAIPESSHCKSVEIIDANRTITPNCICIENINAVYSNTNSSIQDSLVYNGSRCLVLNDEIHHAYNKVSGNSAESKSIKRWKEFLLDSSYNFKYIIGFTGTAYIDNDYFNDVIYRYSLKEAITEGFVKRVNYIDKNSDENENEKFQKILANHNKNKEVYSNIKPLTILITKDIKAAKQLRTRLMEFLEKQAGESGIDEKVLLVTSDSEHKKNVLRLPYVDDKDDPTEWIISVAMLTEGWDVKNVLQIVPMEDKAFNSKLLIAQVLGRGLRIPKDYPNIEVTVFNHSNWSKNIKNLVQEVLEMETTFKNGVIVKGDRGKYNFSLYNLAYRKEKQEIVIDKDIQTFNYKSYFNFDSEVFNKESEIEYIKVGNQEVAFKQKYNIKKDKYLISDILDKIEENFKIRKHERILLNIEGEQYTEESLPSRDKVETMIRNSMKRVGLSGDYLGKTNKDKVISAFNTLLRKKPKSVSIIKSPDDLIEIQTSSKQTESVSIAGLLNETSIFYTTEYENEILNKDCLDLLKELSDDRQYRGSLFENNVYEFKTSVDMVFTHGTPEEKFVKELLRRENAQNISSWVKSNNQNFYSIEYSIRKGTHSTTHLFSPDFFIKINTDELEYISVIEIKADGDDCEENVQKNKYAKEHFLLLNEELSNKGIKQFYLFNFLSPTNYAEYFEYLRNGLLTQGRFVSRLDNILEDRLNQV